MSKHNETEMRDAVVPCFETIEELTEYINGLVRGKHDYGSCVYAMSLASTAAFKFVAHTLGVTGLQASCADLDIIRRTRRIDGPFCLIDGRDMLYPQYDLLGRLLETMDKWRPWAADEAKKKLAGDTEFAHPNVIAHWRRLAEFKPEVPRDE